MLLDWTGREIRADKRGAILAIGLRRWTGWGSIDLTG